MVIKGFQKLMETGLIIQRRDSIIGICESIINIFKFNIFFMLYR